MTDNQKHQRTGATTTAALLQNFDSKAALTDFLQHTRKKVTRPPYARFKLAYKKPDGYSSSIFSFDFHRTRENEHQALIDLKDWGQLHLIDPCDCWTATIYATLENDKDTSKKTFNYPLFHWVLKYGKWDYQETAEIRFHADTNKFDRYYHFYNPSTIKFKRTV